jgi:hypothetical protein
METTYLNEVKTRNAARKVLRGIDSVVNKSDYGRGIHVDDLRNGYFRIWFMTTSYSAKAEELAVEKNARIVAALEAAGFESGMFQDPFFRHSEVLVLGFRKAA